jgi:hypothetical protein
VELVAALVTENDLDVFSLVHDESVLKCCSGVLLATEGLFVNDCIKVGGVGSEVEGWRNIVRGFMSGKATKVSAYQVTNLIGRLGGLWAKVKATR